MKHLLLISVVWLLSLFAFPFSVGFNYSDNPPKEIFSLYDWVVVEPTGIENVKDIKRNYDAKIFAYVSVGEKTHPKNMKWVLGKNKEWHSYIMDLRNPQYRKTLFEHLKKLKNYDGFMFDTIDSYQMVLNAKGQKSYERALVNFIRKVHKEFPHKKILLNRGFRIIPEVRNDINGVLAENLYTIEKNGKIFKQPKSETKWLLDRLYKVKRMGLKTIVIDYVKTGDTKKAVKLAKKILHAGFIPFVSNLDLTMVGVSSVKLIPRKILVLYQGNPKVAWKYNAHDMYSMPLEFLGYIPILWNMKKPLPQGYLKDRYAGIVVAFEGSDAPHQAKFFKWIYKNIKDGMKVVFMSNFGFDNVKFYKKLHLQATNPTSFNYHMIYGDKITDFEIKPGMYSIADSTIINPINTKYKKIMQFENSNNQKFITCAYMPWGGYCFNQFVDINKKSLWSINPFLFFQRALQLKNIPLPDTTTENGNRILTSHIDGDGFADINMVHRKFAPEMLYEQVFTKYSLPISASIIEGEVAPYGLYPKRSKGLIKVAKKIYRLPNIEAGSHAFSHPFKWDMKNPPRLPIKNYTHFSIRREILGSIKFIQKLLPKNKKINLFFWTGDCLPQQNAMKLCYTHHILNINGGDTTITDKEPFLMNVMPMGLYVGKYFQVYAPITNENIYTDLWKHKAGFVKVIQTLKLTGYPRRLKPFGIYYHFYTGSTTQSLMALKMVYNWVLKQNIIPMFISKYIKIVLDYERTVVAKSITSDAYIIRNKGDLRTLKIRGKKIVNFQKSINVVGEQYERGWTYIALSNNEEHKVVFAKNTNIAYLVSANGRIKKYQKLRNGYKLKIRSWLPLKLQFKYKRGCSIKFDKHDYSKILKNGILTYKFHKTRIINIRVNCE